MQIEENKSLAELTTFQIGGKAKFFVRVESATEALQAVDFARQKNLPIFVLGRGSNIVVSDRGFEGLVIKNEIKGLEIKGSLMEIGAGETWDDVVRSAVERKLAGIECLSGIPGSAGGAAVQNIGAYGQTLADVVSNIEAIEVATGESKIFLRQECEFTYRSSLFKNNPNKYIVTKFQLKLDPAGEPTVTYAHIVKHFEKRPKPNLAELRQFIIKIRGSKGYLIMLGYESYKTAGSFFKNPVVSLAQFEKLKDELGDRSLNRYWEQPNGVKIAVAYLMEKNGFVKGYRKGSVGISPKHSLSIINLGHAKASEVKKFAEEIKKTIKDKTGIDLEEEILYVGKFDN